MPSWTLRILETPQEMEVVEALQRAVWPGSETDVVPAHVMLAAVHNGGLVVGAYAAPDEQEQRELEWPPEQTAAPQGPLVGFVFGFPGLYFTPDGPRPKHASHMLGVHPAFRSRGLGFALKRAQWQMVRHQGLDRITWTYDPLLSQNAHLNIARLGAVCNTYRRNEYGEMRDGLNVGLPSDRLVVDWWVNTKRVERRLSSRPRLMLDLAHFLAAETRIINPSYMGEHGYPVPPEVEPGDLSGDEPENADQRILLMEVPPNFLELKAADLGLAKTWRSHTRSLFERLFQQGYLITDFIYLRGAAARSFYVLSHGESTF